MEIYMQKIGLIRQNLNPSNLSLDLDIDWAVEYTNTDQHEINFGIVLKTCGNLKLNFKIEGILILDLFEDFIHDKVSQIIFYRACNILMEMVSITNKSEHILSSDLDMGSEQVPNTLYN